MFFLIVYIWYLLDLLKLSIDSKRYLLCLVTRNNIEGIL